MKGFALSLVLKVRVVELEKWPNNSHSKYFPVPD